LVNDILIDEDFLKPFPDTKGSVTCSHDYFNHSSTLGQLKILLFLSVMFKFKTELHKVLGFFFLVFRVYVTKREFTHTLMWKLL